MAEKPLRAAVYARISDDQEGRQVGVDRQIEDCKGLAERLGWTVVEVLIDNDISASGKSKRRRPSFDRLIAGVGCGEYDGVLYYSTSRLTRRPREFETIIELVDDTGVRMASCVSGIADLTTAQGRMIGRILAAQDAAESDLISERVTRANEHRRQKLGLPNPAGRSFGFEAGGVIVNPTEAEAIRYAATLILQGASLREVGRKWTERGIKPLGDKGIWYPITIRRILKSGRVAGLLEHKGKIIGPGQFEAILDQDTWQRVRAAISDRSSLARAQYKGRVHLLSGLVWCGVCGHRISVRAVRTDAGDLSPASYLQCVKGEGGCGKIKRRLIHVQEYVYAVVEERLRDVRPFDAEADDTEEGREIARLVAAKEKQEARIAKLREDYASGESDLDPEDFVPTLRMMRNRLDEINTQLTELDTDGAKVLDVDALEYWQTGTFEERREVFEAVVGQVILHPMGKVGRGMSQRLVPETTEISLN